MTKPQDDLDAVRAIAAALEGFDAPSQERILRWARERVGLGSVGPPTPPAPGAPAQTQGAPLVAKDIKSFVDAKGPKTDNQFAAVVAYYYRFEAPPAEQKTSITATDLQDATRKAGRARLKKPIDTLHNAHKKGLLDKAGTGAFSVNTVGENLVAMILPQPATAGPTARQRRRAPAKERSRKKR